MGNGPLASSSRAKKILAGVLVVLAIGLLVVTVLYVPWRSPTPETMSSSATFELRDEEVFNSETHRIEVVNDSTNTVYTPSEYITKRCLDVGGDLVRAHLDQRFLRGFSSSIWETGEPLDVKYNPDPLGPSEAQVQSALPETVVIEYQFRNRTGRCEIAVTSSITTPA